MPRLAAVVGVAASLLFAASALAHGPTKSSRITPWTQTTRPSPFRACGSVNARSTIARTTWRRG